MKKYYRKKTYSRPYRKRKFFRRKRGSKRNIMQKLGSAGVTKRYTRVFTPSWGQSNDQAASTVCLAGAKSSTNDALQITFAGVDPDGLATADMKLYLQFCIYGVKVKAFFAEPTDLDNSPVQWSMGYSPNQIINPLVNPERLQSLASFQTGPCSQNKSVSRYFALGYTKKKLGIDFCNTKEYASFGSTNTALYGGQLPIGAGPSVCIKVFRNSSGPERIAMRLQVTYYVKYRGTKGQNPINT